ncbi:undecaprenyl-phosphate glucose phosphotransferase [Uliginosibacterium flavum]|uniref:Undecaprenyl-phosphate glucose phosphotransferase n=1 Tax=Uliginosibacterium flavum TaxID=1396831 RepID=A0ABV2TPM3_9RHOO
MKPEFSSLSWSGSGDGIRARFAFIGFLEALLGPCLAVACLALSVYANGHNFSQQYVILALVIFLLLFPGILKISEDRWKMAGKATLAWLTLCFTLLVFGYATGYLGYFDGYVIATWQLGTLAFLLLAHEITRQVVVRVLRGSRYSAVIIGANDTGVELAQHFERDRYAGIQFRGFFDDRPRERLSSRGGDLHLLGGMQQIASYAKNQKIDHIYIALPMASQPRIIALLDDLRDTTSSVFFVPDLFVTDLIQGRVEQIAGMPVVAVCDTPFTGFNGVLKRMEDVVLGSLIVLLISPVLLAVGLAVKLSSPGPIVFKQRRYGLDGKDVLVYKFRSMTVTEDGDKSYTQVTKGDARVTKVGAFIRKTSLDELPQFINVLQGRMSIVGPRPHAVAVNENYRKQIPGYMVRHKVRPGITGWAQVNGYRGGDDLAHMTKRIEFDLDYLRNWSLKLDLKIILRTVGLVAKDSTAY